MGKMTIFGLILYTLLPFGQLWSRIFDYNGTVEMWWFFIPLFFIFVLFKQYVNPVERY